MGDDEKSLGASVGRALSHSEVSLGDVIESAAVGFGTTVAMSALGVDEPDPDVETCDDCHAAFSQPSQEQYNYRHCPYCGEPLLPGTEESIERATAEE